MEKYEKPELFSQKMELNVLRAYCTPEQKSTNSTDPGQPPEAACYLGTQLECTGCSDYEATPS
jgi:hypothetical protein